MPPDSVISLPDTRRSFDLTEDTTSSAKAFPEESRKQQIHRFFRDPSSSTTARIYCNALDALVIISVITFLIETIPSLSITTTQKLAWFAWECVISGVFFLDFLAKVITQESMQGYLLTRAALIDVLSFFPVILDMLWYYNMVNGRDSGLLFALGFLRFARCFRFSRVSIGKRGEIRLFVIAVKRSKLALFFMLFYVFGVGVFFASCFYYVETKACILDTEKATWFRKTDLSRECPIQHMFDALWMTMVTISTVGYGDYTPQTPIGKILASFLMISTMIMLPLPVSIFSANLIELYIAYRKGHREVEDEEAGAEILGGAVSPKLPGTAS